MTLDHHTREKPYDVEQVNITLACDMLRMAARSAPG